MTNYINKIILATHNSGKVKEFQFLLSDTGIEITSAKELNLVEPEETGKTFIENAILKVKDVESEYPVVGDDSGLVVPALDGMPGIYSARWAMKDGKRDFNCGMQKIKDELDKKQVPESQRTAYFICVLAIKYPDGNIKTIEGRVDGMLTFPPRGDKNFGYDPIFIPNGYNQTFAEMDEELKNKLSHRADAANKLKNILI